MLEEDRLNALRSYDVLDTEPEAAFDELMHLARALCDVPVALVSLIDRDRQWFKSCFGLDASETPRSIAFCARAIEQETPMIVPDARLDPRFQNNPLVTGAPGIQFYAGYPLIDRDGAALGTLCVIDVRPRTLTTTQHDALGVLARQVVAQLHLRRADATLRQQLARDAFLAEAGRLLNASLDIDETLQAVANLAVPRIADLCTIMLVSDDGQLRRVAEAAVAHPLESQMLALRGAGAGSTLAMERALAEKKALLFTDYRGWVAEHLPEGDPYRVIVEQLEVGSAMIAPLIVAGRVRGMLNVAYMERSKRAYDENALVMVEGLAQQAAFALENARLFAEARDANRTKDLFLAAVSHDLRTPLSAIVAWTQLMRRKASDPEMQLRGIEVIERSAQAQSRLIEDLLDVTRVSNGAMTMEQSPVDLATVVGSALDTMRPGAETQEVRVQAALLPAIVLGDSARLTQVVWNLVSNALKFSERGGSVEVALECIDGRARLMVTDHGRGIPLNFLPHVFDRFRQSEDGRKQSALGLGLGLAIAKAIVEASSGTITAHSDGPGTGAIFTVELPLHAEVARTAEER